jgi:hypothetical protein
MSNKSFSQLENPLNILEQLKAILQGFISAVGCWNNISLNLISP